MDAYAFSYSNTIVVMKHFGHRRAHSYDIDRPFKQMKIENIIQSNQINHINIINYNHTHPNTIINNNNNNNNNNILNNNNNTNNNLDNNNNNNKIVTTTQTSVLTNINNFNLLNVNNQNNLKDNTFQIYYNHYSSSGNTLFKNNINNNNNSSLNNNNIIYNNNNYISNMGTRENQPDEAEVFTPPPSPRGNNLNLNNNINNNLINNIEKRQQMQQQQQQLQHQQVSSDSEKLQSQFNSLTTQSTANILVAEDDKMYQLVAKRLLSKLGHSVTIAKNGLKAVEEATSGKPYDFILMDVEMPEMDGLEATGKIRQFEQAKFGMMANSTQRRIPIIAYTTSERSRCMSADVDEHLLKPASVEALKSMITLYLKNKGSDPSKRSTIPIQ
ncbi:hypothetical protein PPL_10608 [Heterostelium album PN500]|uniref:Response regulatory domain-containing protein n=1 Tax=Heterostelium pallidum (strain ATCC 26659 / Pp 5 / PN500) TaxID=670386 RepID=D3BRJ7_HETP5|nr:hypothetical protein PPL_10608 [Heterostelium album PN500]EFA76029.1 hypothetical protein PPL_10608 [Heterostelium album PN500]|eukprot:XP_020428163.1 hypothetical protein PPL_10608 [Heterostelium album PN500]